MSDIDKPKMVGGDKIALLGLFAAALLTARFVVGLKSAVVLSEPVRLRRTSLSVSVPVGNGWQSDTRWGDGNGFSALRSSFFAGGSEPTAWVICRYRATAQTIPPLLRFEKTYNIDGELVETDWMRTGSLVFEWAHVRANEQRVTMFFGTATLPDTMQLDIEVTETAGDVEQAREVFERVVQSVQLDRDSNPGYGPNTAADPERI